MECSLDLDDILVGKACLFSVLNIPWEDTEVVENVKQVRESDSLVSETISYITLAESVWTNLSLNTLRWFC